MAENVIVTQQPLEAAANELAKAIAGVDAELGWARVAAGGGPLLDVLRLVPGKLSRGEWSRLRLTWTDEPCEGDTNRARAYAWGVLSAEKPVAKELSLFAPGDAPELAVKRATRRFEEDFSSGLDVSLLELFDDGHVASVFPGHAVRFSTAPVAFVSDAPEPPARRLTFTYKALRTARVNVLYAVGASKRAAIEKILSGDPLAPANILPGALVIVTDQQVG